MDSPEPRAVARRAVLVTVAVYLGYATLGWLGAPADLQLLALVGAFYFAPQWALRGDEARQREYQVGPGRAVPPWSWRAGRLALAAGLLVFPPFVLGFLWFYREVCSSGTGLLDPVLVVESLTPLDGTLERTLHGFCRHHAGAFWPARWSVPTDWHAYAGLGFVLSIAIEVFVIALPEELFHRGYLMSALEERFPPRAKVFGVRLGLAALLSSGLFAFGHLAGQADVGRLATFFPSLVFAWLWRRSGSLWAPTLFHAGANLLMTVLIASTFPSPGSP